MKKLFFIAFVLLCAIGVSSDSIRVKRGLSSEEKKKLVDALNADRRNLGMNHNETFKTLKYDMELEQQADAMESGGKCPNLNFAPLIYDSHFLEMFEKAPPSDVRDMPLFDPRQTKIGCNTKFTCSSAFPHNDGNKEHTEKTLTFYGICLLGPENNKGETMFSSSDLPKMNKYGDLLGIVGSSGRVFSLTLFLGLLVFYY